MVKETYSTRNATSQKEPTSGPELVYISESLSVGRAARGHAMPRADGRNAFKSRPRRGLRGAVARRKSHQAASAAGLAFPGSAGAAQPPSPAAADAEEDSGDKMPDRGGREAPPRPRRPPLPESLGMSYRRADHGLAEVAWRPGLPDEEAATLLREHEVMLLQSEVNVSQAAAWRSVQLHRARTLWRGDYDPLLVQESLEQPELRSQVSAVFNAQLNTYRSQLTARNNEDLMRRYDAKTERMIRDTVAVARRRRNQSDIPFSVLARSISDFNQRVPFRVWRDQQKSLRIVSRETVLKLLHVMMEVEPRPPFILNPHVAVFGFDQCNHWQAAATSKKGHFRGAERVNSQGMPICIRSETVLNVVQRHIPFTNPLLSAAEVQLISEEGRALACRFQPHLHLWLADG
jgi:hypothetical protein